MNLKAIANAMRLIGFNYFHYVFSDATLYQRKYDRRQLNLQNFMMYCGFHVIIVMKYLHKLNNETMLLGELIIVLHK